MPLPSIDYHIADVEGAWGIFRDGVQIALRADPADAIAFANFFADRETPMAPCPVRVSGGDCLRRELRRLSRTGRAAATKRKGLQRPTAPPSCTMSR